MKKKIIVLIILLMPFIVKASSLSLECNTDVVKTEQLSCTIKGNSTTNITSISAKVITGNNINFVSFTPSSAWKGDGEEGQIELYTADDINGNFNIGTINFKVTSLYDGGTSSITIDQISFYDEDGIEESITKVTKNIRIASNNNDLSSLSLSNGNIYPTFNKDTTSYSTQINANSVTITARASSNKATISGDIGTKNLNYGNNNFNIIVTSESGNKKTYTISIVRPNNNNNTPVIEDKKSSNNYLSNITLSTGNINFNKEILEYNVSVLYEVKDIDITAVPEDSKSKVEISGNKELKVGTNKITILVTAEDGSKREYIINVDRKNEDEKLSNNTNISKLIIDNYNINFNKDKLNYDLKIKYEKKLNINVELEDSTSTYKIQGNNNLNNKSIIKIIVTSADNSTKTYTINIKNNDTIIKIAFVLLITVLIIINILRIILKKRQFKILNY